MKLKPEIKETESCLKKQSRLINHSQSNHEKVVYKEITIFKIYSISYIFMEWQTETIMLSHV